MQNFTKYLVLIIFGFCFQNIIAQDSIPKTKNSEKIIALKNTIERIKIEEKEALKKEVEAIDLKVKKRRN